MLFECSQCGQSLEIDDAAVGQKIDCPTCGKSILLPSSVPPESYAGSSPQPPVYVPLQPLAPGTSTPLIKKRKGVGCGSFLLLLILALGAAFGYEMYRSQESPRETWDRLTSMILNLVHPAPTPAPEVTPESPEPTPRPDPLTWLAEHKSYWPNEVTLLEPIDFPAMSDGKIAGSLKLPAGAAVKLVDIPAGDEIEVGFMGGSRRVPIAVTDLVARADAALRRAEADEHAAQQKTPAGKEVGGRKETMPADSVREVSRDEIRNGLGALYTRKATTFRIFAPNTKAVSLVLYDQATSEDGRTIRGLRQQSNGLWDLTVRGDLRGKYYTYLLNPNEPKGGREVLDPYAVNAVASSTRARITPMTKPVAAGPKIESPTDAIIFEMQVRDFTIAPNSGVTNSGLYLGWTESGTRLSDDQEIQTALDHLTELGVTHVELMPVQDFENDETTENYNWGYITSAFFSPEGMFATNPNDNSRVPELKALISALHSRGIGVIMDVVYNHTSGKASLMSIAPDYYYRRSPNGSLANGSGCGNEVRSEAPMARRLILDSLKYWVREYGVDGFRFDLMALIDQETIRQADRELRKIRPGVILFGEPWTGGATPLREKSDKGAISRLPVGAFNDDFRNALKGSPDGVDPGWIQNGSKRDALKTAMLVNDWFAAPGQSINYMTCHDNLVLWDKLVHSMPDATDSMRIETMKLGYLALFTSQGVPFIHGGEEFARTKGGNNNSFEAPDSVNQVDWQLKREHLDLFNYVRDVIALRKAHPLFRLRTKPEVRSRVQFIDPPDHNVLMFTINGEGLPGETWKRACVVLNSSDTTEARVGLPGGEWLLAMDESGAVSPTPLTGKLILRQKSGVVLYQQ